MWNHTVVFVEFVLSRYWIELCHKAAFAIIAFVVLLFLSRRHLHPLHFRSVFKLSLLASEPLGCTSREIGSISLNRGDLMCKQKGYY